MSDTSPSLSGRQCDECGRPTGALESWTHDGRTGHRGCVDPDLRRAAVDEWHRSHDATPEPGEVGHLRALLSRVPVVSPCEINPPPPRCGTCPACRDLRALDAEIEAWDEGERVGP